MHAPLRVSWLGPIVSRCVLAFVAAFCIAGCQRELIPTPYVMLGERGREQFEAVPEELRTPEIPVFYVTDRAVARRGERGPEYGYDRSPEVQYGVARVSLGEGVDWPTLVADSTAQERSRVYHPKVVSIEPLGALPPTVSKLEAKDGRIRAKPGAYDEFRCEQEALCGALSMWLDHTPRKEALVFIHGYNNTFDDAILRLAEAWHTTGRSGVPIVFTWPAGSGGLRGYAYDRESGEFAVVHLKVLLWALARCPEIERVHIISHSRGTDVASTALRELNAEIRGALGTGPLTGQMVEFGVRPGGERPPEVYEVLKLETLILAAPDLDVDVFRQRFFGENVLRAANRVVIYFSEGDRAIGLADWLFRSKRRLGALRVEDITEGQRSLLTELDSLEMIDCRVTGYTSHSYVLQHPAALSDLLLVLSGRARPGPGHGRPLGREADGVWLLDNDYLKPGAAGVEVPVPDAPVDP